MRYVSKIRARVSRARATGRRHYFIELLFFSARSSPSDWGESLAQFVRELVCLVTLSLSLFRFPGIGEKMPRSLPPFLSFFSRAIYRGPGVPTNYIAGHKDTSDDFSCFSVTVAELLSRRNVDYLRNVNFLSRARGEKYRSYYLLFVTFSSYVRWRLNMSSHACVRWFVNWMKRLLFAR